MSASKVGFRFQPEWRISLLTALLLPTLVGLGFWQIQRAEEKASLASAFEEQQLMPPAALTALWESPAETLAYRSVEVVGEYVPDAYFLLDNRTWEGQSGYEVLQVMRLETGEGVLINRGWVSAGADRGHLPEVPAPSSGQRITGHVYVSPGQPYLLAPQVLSDDWPQRIQAVEMDKLAVPVQSRLGGRLFPYPIRIDAEAPGALRVNWTVINVSPDKHYAYAVQWFSMALVLLLVYLLQSSNLRQWVSRGAGNDDDNHTGKV